MSKIGKQPIKIPSEIKVVIENDLIKIKSAKGEMVVPVLAGVNTKLEGDTLTFDITADTKQNRSNWGALRALVANAVAGLTKEFEKALIIEGVGFRMVKEGNDLVMSLGFSHPVRYKMPTNVAFEVEKGLTLKLKSFDKCLLGQVAAEIRSMKKPEPYKGKGFRYIDEVIRRKAGKRAGATSTAA